MESEKAQPPEPKRSLGDMQCTSTMKSEWSNRKNILGIPSGPVRWGACYHSLYFLGKHSQVTIFKHNHKKLIPHHNAKGKPPESQASEVN
jgi:hypothetical protein